MSESCTGSLKKTMCTAKPRFESRQLVQHASGAAAAQSTREGGTHPRRPGRTSMPRRRWRLPPSHLHAQRCSAVVAHGGGQCVRVTYLHQCCNIGTGLTIRRVEDLGSGLQPTVGHLIRLRGRRATGQSLWPCMFSARSGEQERHRPHGVAIVVIVRQGCCRACALLIAGRSGRAGRLAGMATQPVHAGRIALRRDVVTLCHPVHRPTADGCRGYDLIDPAAAARTC